MQADKVVVCLFPQYGMRCWFVGVSRSIGDILCLWVEQKLIFDSGFWPEVDIDMLRGIPSICVNYTRGGRIRSRHLYPWLQ